VKTSARHISVAYKNRPLRGWVEHMPFCMCSAFISHLSSQALLYMIFTVYTVLLRPLLRCVKSCHALGLEFEVMAR
jgi:hypothetical protein